MRVGRASVAVAVVLAVLLGAPIPVAASDHDQPCMDNYPGDRWFDGANAQRLQSTRGSGASIEYRNPDLCGPTESTGHGSSSVWAMVTAYPADGTGESYYAQSGWSQDGNLSGDFTPVGIHMFTQWVNKSGTDFNGDWGPNPPGRQTYTVRKEPSDGHIYMYWGGVLASEMPYNPAGDWAGKWQAQFNGETLWQTDDISGTSSNPNNLKSFVVYDANLNVTSVSSWPSGQPSTNYPEKYHWFSYTPGSGGLGVAIYSDPS